MSWRGRLGWALVVVVCLATPWVTRALLLYEKRSTLRLVDARGFVADASTALVMIGLVGLSLRLHRTWGRALAVVIAVLFVVVSFALYEFISVFDSLYALSHSRFVLDATFVGGSARHVRHPVLLGILAVAAIVGASLARLPPARSWRGWGIALVACFVGQMLFPVSPAFDGWRQRHALQANAWVLAKPTEIGPARVVSDLREVFSTDLRGRRWIGPLEGRPNVLLIMVEGASAAYLPSVAAEEGIRTSTRMPKLDALAQRHVLLSQVISHQRQTNRGEYGILCGDYPKLVTDQSKMTEQAYGTARRCLPAVLRDAGYTTVYMQAAPLGFMLKDQFMPKAGFEEVLGEPWFGRSYARTDWGVDDKAFFEQAVARVTALHREDAPFFATLLTVGTHHPYTVPGVGPERDRVGAHDLAFRWADDALAAFLSTLERAGVLRDTVVIITSDESAGLSGIEDATQKLLSQSWSFVVVMLPEPHARRIDTLYGHVDTPLSILDLLGMETSEPRFLGRSWFRDYEEGRPVFAGNTYARKIMMWEPRGAVVICNESFPPCVKTVPDDGLRFGANRHTEAPTARETQLLMETARLTRSASRTLAESGALKLLADPVVRVAASEGKKLLIGGQYLRVPAQTVLRVDLDLEIEGDHAVVDFHHDTFLDGYPKLVRRKARVPRGSRWQLRYEIGVPQDAGQLVVQLYATSVSGDAAIRVHEAQLTMTDGAVTSTDTVVLQDELTGIIPP